MSYLPFDDQYFVSVPEQLFDHARDHFEGLLHAVYKSGKVEDIKFHLDEIGLLFDKPTCSGEAAIVKKKTSGEMQLDRALQHWMFETRMYAEEMCKKAQGKK